MSPRRSLSRSAACALAAAAIAAPAAAASPAVDPPAHNSMGGAIEFESEAPVPAEGLEWSSAAIGAGGVMVIVLVTGAGVSTLRRHQRHTGLVH